MTKGGTRPYTDKHQVCNTRQFQSCRTCVQTCTTSCHALYPRYERDRSSASRMLLQANAPALGKRAAVVQDQGSRAAAGLAVPAWGVRAPYSSSHCRAAAAIASKPLYLLLLLLYVAAAAIKHLGIAWTPRLLPLHNAAAFKNIQLLQPSSCTTNPAGPRTCPAVATGRLPPAGHAPHPLDRWQDANEQLHLHPHQLHLRQLPGSRSWVIGFNPHRPCN